MAPSPCPDALKDTYRYSQIFTDITDIHRHRHLQTFTDVQIVAVQIFTDIYIQIFRDVHKYTQISHISMRPPVLPTVLSNACGS